MQPPDFVTPLNEEEFKKRADTYTLEGAQNVIKTLQHRRAQAVKPIDEEIAFLEKVVTLKEGKS